ncbi:uncharacterized protein TNCV_815121 [Trichonephila clavipes]|nr:uncharacterized protein TNCV_815121 [Trichonephila clavipes]
METDKSHLELESFPYDFFSISSVFVEVFVEFKSVTHVQRKRGTTTLDFGSEKKFPRRWIERGSPIPWSPRSLDIAPLDFFLLEYVKNIVYHSPIRNTGELKSQITAVIQDFDNATLHRTWSEISYRHVAGNFV